MTAPETGLRHEEIQELLGAYALDAVDKDTGALVEQHLPQCVRCTIEISQHHEVAGLLANSGGASPTHLWDGIASRLDGSDPPGWEGLAGRLETGEDRADRVLGTFDDPSTGPAGEPRGAAADVVPLSSPPGRRRLVARIAAVAAAAAALVAIALGLQVHHLDNQVNALRTNPSLSAAEQSALREPSTRQVPLTAPAGTPPARVTVVLTRSGTGFVEAAGLSTLGKDQTYQLWGVIGHQTISLGLLGPSPGVVPFSVAGNAPVDAFAVTAERAGGVVRTTSRPVVAGAVST